MKLPRPSLASVIAVIALFVALGGGAYAISLGKGDVKSKNIARDAVKSKHLKDGKAVKSVDVADGSLTGADLAPGTFLGPPKALARVSAGGTIDQAQGISQSQVLNTATEGTYCFDIDATHAQVSGGWLGNATGPAQTIFVLDDALADQAMPGGPEGTQHFGCGASHDFVVGVGIDGNDPEDSSFWVMFF